MQDGIYMDFFVIKNGVRYNVNKPISLIDASRVFTNKIMDAFGEISGACDKEDK